MKKIVYIARHGECEANDTGVRGGKLSPLTERGKLQAKALSSRMKDLRFDTILTSDFPRAHDTAKEVSQETGVPITLVSEIFGERRNPSAMLGHHVNDPEVEAIWDEIKAHYDDPLWHHSDEENFADLRGRAIDALQLLRERPEERLFVASHGLFMKMLFAEVAMHRHLTPRIFWECFIPMKNIQNTGIMLLEYAENFHKTAMVWKLHLWNDHAHLSGDLRNQSRFMA